MVPAYFVDMPVTINVKLEILPEKMIAALSWNLFDSQALRL